MARLTHAGAAGLCVLLLGTTALHADVTAEQVWDAWNKQYTAYGYQVSAASSAKSGDTLVVSDLKMTNTADNSTFEVTIPELRLREIGDGTVEMTLSKELDATAKGSAEGQKSVEMDIKITQSDATTIVSGTPDALSYDLTAPEVVVELSDVSTSEQKNAPVKFWMSANGITGKYLISGADTQTITSSSKVAGLKMTLSGADPESGNTIDIKGTLADLVSESTAVMPKGVDMKNFGGALGQGMKANGSVTYGASDYTITSTAEQGPITIKGNAEKGSLDVVLASEGVRYAATGTNAALSVEMPQIPTPLSATLDQTEFDVNVPLAAADQPQPFVAKLGLVGLKASDQVWGLFDPQGHLSHDPATLVIDLSGTAKPLIDLFSPEAAQSKVPPVEVDSLDINKLQLTVAGGDLTGNGALTFDNSMGMPMPIGAIDLKLAGANKVLDGLVAMGLMPQDQVMFARMMLGLYAVPAGDDLMTSKIEFKQGGEILANGQRIK